MNTSSVYMYFSLFAYTPEFLLYVFMSFYVNGHVNFEFP